MIRIPFLLLFGCNKGIQLGLSLVTNPKPYTLQTPLNPQTRHLTNPLNRIWAAFRDQSNGNKSYILELGHYLLGGHSSANKLYILAFGHHFDAKAAGTNHTSQHGGTTSRPKQQQQIVHLGIGAPLPFQSNGNKSHILALAPN